MRHQSRPASRYTKYQNIYKWTRSGGEGGHSLTGRAVADKLPVHKAHCASFAKGLRAKFHLGGILRNRCIEKRIKCSMYKLNIRPISFGGSVWCRQPPTSAASLWAILLKVGGKHPPAKRAIQTCWYRTGVSRDEISTHRSLYCNRPR